MCLFSQLLFPASRNLLLRDFLRQRWCLWSTAPTTSSDCFVCKLLASPKFCVCVWKVPPEHTKHNCNCSQNTNLVSISLPPPMADWGTVWRLFPKSLWEISVIFWGCLIGIKLQELLGRQWAESCLPRHQSLSLNQVSDLCWISHWPGQDKVNFLKRKILKSCTTVNLSLSFD